MRCSQYLAIGSIAVFGLMAGCAQVSSENGYRFVAVEDDRSCALTEDGHATCWGCVHGQGGTSGTDTSPEMYPGCEGADDSDELLVRIDMYSTCSNGVTTTGGVVNWGDCYCDPGDWTEQGDAVDKIDGSSTALTTSGELLLDCGETRYTGPYTDFGRNGAVVCAIRNGGSLECWETGTDEDRHDILEHPSGSFVAVDIDGATACALEDNGEIRCWGCRDIDGRDVDQCDDPEGEFIQVSAGQWHACAIDTEGDVHCWGDDEYGQASPPKGTFTQVAAGEYHSCGVRDDGHVVCWGCGIKRPGHGINFGQCTPP